MLNNLSFGTKLHEMLLVSPMDMDVKNFPDDLILCWDWIWCHELYSRHMPSQSLNAIGQIYLRSGTALLQLDFLAAGARQARALLVISHGEFSGWLLRVRVLSHRASASAPRHAKRRPCADYRTRPPS